MRKLGWTGMILGLIAMPAAAGPQIAPQPVPKLPEARIAAGPPPGTRAAQDMVHQWGQVVAIVSANMRDCAAMAAGLQAFDAQNGPALRADQAVLDALSPAEKVMVMDPLKPQMTRIAQDMQPGIHACGQDKGVQAAMLALGKLSQ